MQPSAISFDSATGVFSGDAATSANTTAAARIVVVT